MLSGVDRDSALQPTAFDVCGCVHVCACQGDACQVMKCLWMSVCVRVLRVSREVFFEGCQSV